MAKDNDSGIYINDHKMSVVDAVVRFVCNGVHFEARILGKQLYVRSIDGAMIIHPDTSNSILLEKRFSR
jgi:hypothetical protein